MEFSGPGNLLVALDLMFDEPRDRTPRYLWRENMKNYNLLVDMANWNNLNMYH